MIDTEDYKVLGPDFQRVGFIRNCKRASTEVAIIDIRARVGRLGVGGAGVVGRGIPAAVGGVAFLASGLHSYVSAGGEAHFGSVWGWDGVAVEHPAGDGTAVKRLVDAAVGTVKAVDGGVEDSNVGEGGREEGGREGEDGSAGDASHGLVVRGCT